MTLPRYAFAKLPTPILNTPHFKDVFRMPLALDTQNLLRAVEAVALPGTKFQLLSPPENLVQKVITRDYPGHDLYVDSRFLDFSIALPEERIANLPKPSQILERLHAKLGLPYVWGGNWGDGIEEMLTFYPPSKLLDALSKTMWTLKGLDCSGLLYEATDGFTPRNTSQLIRFGKSVSIHQSSVKMIAERLRPLDLIVWSGHVVIVENGKEVIESRHPLGVIRTSLIPRLREIMQERHPVDDWDTTCGPRFVVRRWI